MTGEPDRMLCNYCGTAFEVELNGPRIRLAMAPPALAGRPDLLGAWLMPSEIRARADQALLEGSQTPPAPQPAEAPEPHSAAPAPPTPTNGANATPEPEPGSDDWYSQLAAVIGGLAPTHPPSDRVLADELEQALTERPVPEASAPVPEPQTTAEPAATADYPAAPDDVVAANKAVAADNMVADDAAAESPAAPEGQGLPSAAAPPDNAPAPSATPAEMAPIGSSAPAPEATPGASTLAAEPTILPAPDVPEQRDMAPVAATPEPVAAASPADARALVPAAGATVVAAAEAGALGTTPSRHELAERAWKLHEIGNTLPSIQAALVGMGALPDDVTFIMAKLVALEQAREARFRRTVIWAAGGTLGVIFVLLVIAVLLSLNSGAPQPSVQATLAPASATALQATVGAAIQNGTPVAALTQQAQPTATPLPYNVIVALLNQMLPGDVKIVNGPSPTPAPTSSLFGGLFPASTATPTAAAAASGAPNATATLNSAGLPAWVSTLVPPNVTVLNVPTPSVDSNGPPAGPCPVTAQQASALFGGPAASWSYNRDQRGWIFILADNPTTVRVPAGMAAGYLVIGGQLEMRSADGPATLHNVNFVAITCQ